MTLLLLGSIFARCLKPRKTSIFPSTSAVVGSLNYHSVWVCSQAPVAVLPPPVYFSRTAVRRIACAILRKLQSANLLPSYLSLVSTTNTTYASRLRVSQFQNPLVASANRTDSWTTFDLVSPPKLPMSEHASAVYDAIDLDEAPSRDSGRERKLSLITGIGMKKFSLRTDVTPQCDLSAFEVPRPGVRERPISRNVSYKSLLKTPKSVSTFDTDGYPVAIRG